MVTAVSALYVAARNYWG